MCVDDQVKGTTMRYAWPIVLMLVLPVFVTTAAAQPAPPADCSPLAWDKDKQKIAGFWGAPKNPKGELLKDGQGNPYPQRLVTPVFIGLANPAAIVHGVDV